MAAHSTTAASDDTDGESGRSSRLERVERRQRDISDSIDELRDGAPNEQVEQLVDVLGQMSSELRRLEARNRNLETRLKKVEAVNGLTGDEISLADVSELDHRDEKVVRAIVADGLETVTLSDLQELYRNRTDVRSKETLRDRVRQLTKRGPFEREGVRSQRKVWRFTGFKSQQ